MVDMQVSLDFTAERRTLKSLVTRQPFKAFYLLAAIIWEFWSFMIWLVMYFNGGGRPLREWTGRQVLARRLMKAGLQHASIMQIKSPMSLKAGSEKRRFVIMEPGATGLYTGPTNDREIKPERIGGTWSPEPILPGMVTKEKQDVDVILHFHGGAYVIGDGRDRDAGFAAKTMLNNTKATHIMMLQYRLSSNAGGRFPAALQDAVTSYAHLTRELGIPASRITISGDSAGGNLALALLRYIAEHGEAAGLAWPAAALLWSPWVNVHGSLDRRRIERNPNYTTDYIGGRFGQWGALELTGYGRIDATDPYLSPLGHAFRSETPVWMQVGDKEVLCREDLEMAKQFEVAGTRVGVDVKENTPHDIIMAGHILGFQREAKEAAIAAGMFIEEFRHEGDGDEKVRSGKALTRRR